MISLITLTFNNYDQLVDTLNSIPKDKSVESIVVNGGTCQDTFNYLKDYNGKVINEKDDGISDAFNKGILASTGKYIMIMNSGDILLREEIFQRELKKYWKKRMTFHLFIQILFSMRNLQAVLWYIQR